MTFLNKQHKNTLFNHKDQMSVLGGCPPGTGINRMIENNHSRKSKAETALPQPLSFSKVLRYTTCDAFSIFKGTACDAFQTGFNRIPFS